MIVNNPYRFGCLQRILEPTCLHSFYLLIGSELGQFCPLEIWRYQETFLIVTAVGLGGTTGI